MNSNSQTESPVIDIIRKLCADAQIDTFDAVQRGSAVYIQITPLREDVATKRLFRVMAETGVMYGCCATSPIGALANELRFEVGR